MRSHRIAAVYIDEYVSVDETIEAFKLEIQTDGPVTIWRDDGFKVTVSFAPRRTESPSPSFALSKYTDQYHPCRTCSEPTKRRMLLPLAHSTNSYRREWVAECGYCTVAYPSGFCLPNEAVSN